MSSTSIRRASSSRSGSGSTQRTVRVKLAPWKVAVLSEAEGGPVGEEEGPKMISLERGTGEESDLIGRAELPEGWDWPGKQKEQRQGRVGSGCQVASSLRGSGRSSS